MQVTTREQSPSPRSEAIWRGPHILRNWAYFWIALVTLIWVAPYSFGMFICVGVALHSLRGTRHSVEALGILGFLLVLAETDVMLGRWLILFTAGARMIWDGVFSGKSVPRVIYPLLFFYITILAVSVLASQFPLVSGLKVTSFIFGVAVLTTGFFRTKHLQDYWLSWLFTFGLFLLLISLPFYGLEAGYAAGDAGFQGILGHPQTFGPVAATITALLTGLYFFRQRTSGIILFAVGLGWIGVYLSFSRTSLLALILAGIGTAVLAFFLKPTTWFSDFAHAARRPLVIVSAIVVFSLAALQWTPLQASVETSLDRSETDASLVQTFEESRGFLIRRSMSNFWKRPITGIGFGVPSDAARFGGGLERGAFGIPLSASVEKGFMPTAVLEETGIVGAILTTILLIFLVAPVLWHPDPTLFWMMATCLFVNFGEMVFFSIGGLGFFLWFVMAFCHVAALKRPGRRHTATSVQMQQRRARTLANAGGGHR